MLHGTKLRDAFFKKDIEIISTNTDFPFTPDQITEDSIDLRIGNYGYIMNNKYSYVNTLSTNDFGIYYKSVDIPLQGFILEPHQILFVPTLEKVHICKTIYCGHLTGRSVFARMGLSVHCTQSKFTTGMNAVVPLQIMNNNDKVALRIYPYQKLAQLIIEPVSTDGGSISSSESQFAKEDLLQLPKILNKDRAHYKNEMTQDSFCELPPLNQVKIKHSNSILQQYCQIKIGEFKTLTGVFLGILSGSIFGLMPMSRSVSDTFLPVEGWVELGLVSLIGTLYFWSRYRQVSEKIRICNNSDE